MNKEYFQIKKVCYKAFKRAVEGDMNEVGSIMDLYQRQQMIILSKIPGCSKLRQEICSINMQLSSKHTQNKRYFSVGTSSQNGVISHMNNYFYQNQKLQNVKSLGYQENDYPDLLVRTQNPKIENFNFMEKKFIDFSHLIFQGFFKVVDLYLKNNVTKNIIQHQSQFLENYVNNSVVQKYRNIMFIPSQNYQNNIQDQSQNLIQDSFIFDVNMATIIFKEMYIIQDQSSKFSLKEIMQPDCGAGLIIKDLYGSSQPIFIQDDELIILGGHALQILTNNILRFQPNYFRYPKDKNIGAILNTTSFYPPLDTKMEFSEQKQENEFQKLEKNSIHNIFKFSNDWRQGVSFINFHHNYILQLLLKEFLGQQQKKYNINDEIQIQHHTVQLSQGQIKLYQFSQIDSTMEIAKFWNKNYVSEQNSFAFIADQQINGKGQNFNSWLSPKGNCYVTFLIKFDSELSYCISQLTALSVLETIQQLPVKIKGSQYSQMINPQLKWINDIYINDRKVSGVLCKCDGDYLSIGIGVNLNVDPTLDTATYLKKELNIDEDINVIDFIKSLSINLMKNLLEVRIQKNYQNQIAKIMKKLMYMNQEVIIYDETLTIKLEEGIFIGLNQFGNAILLKDGQQLTIIHGRMRKAVN